MWRKDFLIIISTPGEDCHRRVEINDNEDFFMPLLNQTSSYADLF